MPKGLQGFQKGNQLGKRNKGKHLSLKTEFKEGHNPSEKIREKMRRAQKRNPIRYWLGKNRSEETKKKLRKSLKGKYAREKSSNWQGDNAGYIAKHLWVHKIRGKSLNCEDCGREGFYYLRRNGVKVWSIQWSNIDGKYTRNPDDYRGLCVPCHRKYDSKE